jgi:3-phosphoshikimate 1-carboxyvinyltransferase
VTAFSDQPTPMTFTAAPALSGSITVPGDKSISHRSLMLSALAVGESRVEGLLEGEDVLATAAAMRAMGADISKDADGIWHIHGVGVGGLLQPDGPLDMGNSGTSTRLLMGLVASHAITATFVGDASLSKRPMARVTDPLSRMGASFTSSPGDRLPVASAQVKSAILLAGLNTPGITRIVEPVPTRDHSEKMLKGFGADVEVEVEADGTRIITLRGEAELLPQSITVPGDPSSAAFPMVAALLVPGSKVTISNVGLNATRAGLVDLLREMGGDIIVENPRQVGGEPVGDLVVTASSLKGVDPDPARAPSMIDEYPVAFIAAALAEGRSIFRGLEELRVKESDRIATMAAGLRAIGVQVEELEDGIVIEGSNGALLPGGGPIATKLDHRIAMSFAIAGLVSSNGVTIDDMRPVATSFPGFTTLLQSLGALT